MSIPTVTADQASDFLRDADLPVPHRGDDRGIAEATQPPFDPTKNESVVVGSGMVSFKSGVSQPRRMAITNSLLLAQLVLKKKNLTPDAPDWFHEYASVLANLGWLVETSDMSDYVTSDDGLDVHKAIEAVALALLGPGAIAAAPLIKAALDALGSMNTNTPWITLFNRETKRVNTTSFQLAMTDQGADDKLTVSMMAFSLNTSMDITQVLFFKVSKNDANLRKVATTAEIDTSVLDSVQDMLRDKVTAFTTNYLSEINL